MITWVKSNRLLSIIILVCLGFFVYYLYSAMWWVLYPNSIDFGEGFVMNYAKLWENGTWDWDITTPPYMTMVYGVGYPILVQPFIKLFGAELWLGRAVSLISTLAVCGLLYLIVKKITGKKIYGLLASLLPATQPIFRDWSVMARVDMPAVMFDMIGLYLVIKFRDSKWLYIAVVPFLCAMMVKLTAVAGLVAVVIYLFISNKKRLPVFIGLLVVGFGVMLVPLMVASDGLYWKHIIYYQNTIQNFNIPVFMVNWQMFFYAYIPLFLLSLLYLKRYLSRKFVTLVGIFFIVAFIMNAVLTFRPGAAGMYYYEAILAGCICAVLLLHYLITHRKQQMVIIILVFMMVFMAMYSIKTTMPLQDSEYGENIEVVQDMIKDTDKPIVTENPVLVMSAGKDVYIEPFIFTNLARLGYWDDTAYIQQYESQYFDYILLKVSLEQKKYYEAQGFPDSNFTSEVMDAIEHNYTLVYSNEHSYTNPDADWRCFLCLYEANDKLKNDGRQIMRIVK